MVLVVCYSRKQSKKGIVAQLGLTMGFLILGFIKYGASEKSACVMKISLLFAFSQSIMLMILLMVSR